MPKNLYADAAPAPAAAPVEPTDEEPAMPEEAAEDSATAEIPKAVLVGQEFKPGDEVTLQVVEVMEDSVLVRYGPTEEPVEPAAEEAAPMPTTGGAGMYE